MNVVQFLYKIIVQKIVLVTLKQHTTKIEAAGPLCGFTALASSFKSRRRVIFEVYSINKQHIVILLPKQQKWRK